MVHQDMIKTDSNFINKFMQSHHFHHHLRIWQAFHKLQMICSDSHQKMVVKSPTEWCDTGFVISFCEGTHNPKNSQWMNDDCTTMIFHGHITKYTCMISPMGHAHSSFPNLLLIVSLIFVPIDLILDILAHSNRGCPVFAPPPSVESPRVVEVSTFSSVCESSLSSTSSAMLPSVDLMCFIMVASVNSKSSSWDLAGLLSRPMPTLTYRPNFSLQATLPLVTLPGANADMVGAIVSNATMQKWKSDFIVDC